jgi:hypothetical protein
MNIKEIKRVFRSWIPSDNFGIGHPIHTDELEEDFRFLFDQFDGLLEELIYYTMLAKNSDIDRDLFEAIKSDLNRYREARNTLNDPN